MVNKECVCGTAAICWADRLLPRVSKQIRVTMVYAASDILRGKVTGVKGVRIDCSLCCLVQVARGSTPPPILPTTSTYPQETLILL